MAFMKSTKIAARPLRAVCFLGVLSLLALQASAMPPAAGGPLPPPGITANGAGAVAHTAKLAAKPDVRPLWTELTPAQQQALAPLAVEWNKLDSNHKTKWLAIGNKYSMMTPEQQKRFQENIGNWAKLTPEQHRIARESYARAKKLNSEQKTAQWQQYQQLPEEQKEKLAADAAAKKHIVNLPNPKNKTKIVEPLKYSKKPAGAHGSAPQSANRTDMPTPSASAVVTPSMPAQTSPSPSPSAAPTDNK